MHGSQAQGEGLSKAPELGGRVESIQTSKEGKPEVCDDHVLLPYPPPPPPAPLIKL